ncbi:hypothetical protein RO1_01570 [Roseburia intestinalis XB6B4]|uniref:Uncharacterized protein n=1 Tax=Roseburia intestinalis XB6B4 TaxID=718255 RepID=D4KUE3_9FIRM|nr:hypothetical protein RO1_01570 [Roseburia intestinalis XB6B4]
MSDFFVVLWTVFQKLFDRKRLLHTFP